MNRPAWVAWDDLTRTGYCVRCGGGLAALADDEPTRDAEHRSYMLHAKCEVDQAEQNAIAEERRVMREKIAAIDRMEKPRIVVPSALKTWNDVCGPTALDALNRGDDVVRHALDKIENINRKMGESLARKRELAERLKDQKFGDPIVRNVSNPNAHPITHTSHSIVDRALDNQDEYLSLQERIQSGALTFHTAYDGAVQHLDNNGKLITANYQEGYSAGYSNGFKEGRLAGLAEAKSSLQHEMDVERVQKRAKNAGVMQFLSSGSQAIFPGESAEIILQPFVPTEVFILRIHPHIGTMVDIDRIDVGLNRICESIFGTMLAGEEGFHIDGCVVYPGMPMRIRVTSRVSHPVDVKIIAEGRTLPDPY